MVDHFDPVKTLDLIEQEKINYAFYGPYYGQCCGGERNLRSGGAIFRTSSAF